VIVGDSEGQPLPPGEVGLIWLTAAQGDDRFSYFGDDAKTSAAYRGDRFTLGDMGYMDEDGYLFLTDRDANLIISGGVNIYPAEVDAVLLEHPAVADAATIGVPDDEWGESVLAVVELRAGVAPSDGLVDELLVLCRSRLARFKCPRAVDFVEKLPREDNGKIYKRRLRDQYRSQMSP
jgi:long-chain acyl-CoA synthetase